MPGKALYQDFELSSISMLMEIYFHAKIKAF